MTPCVSSRYSSQLLVILWPMTRSRRVECKFPAGPLMGNLSFTPRPDHTIDFVDRDGNYKAVLHRCPN